MSRCCDVQNVFQEGNTARKCCILGCKERKPGSSSAVVEQWASRCGLQRQRRPSIHACQEHMLYITLHSFKHFTTLGTTALMVASHYGHIECVRELVLQGADINLQRESGTTALFFAAQQGHNDVVRFLFEFGASTEFRTKDGGTALLAACQYGHTRVVETLLKHGANIHDQLCDGATALFLAAQGGYLDVIRLLLSSGAKVNQPRQDGTAPLWIASQMGHSEIVRVMLLRGADRDATRNDGTTALLKAANKGYHDVIEELLKFSPALGLLKNGTSALHAAVLGGNIKAVALLLEAGADPSLKNKANELPAELTQNERILRLLRAKEKHRKS
uniref:Ankyrin repeat domain 29 n=2 Tax=Chrysemys picta bellii TaxID=8478 RepID=A0A8C3IXR7_CHRPI